MAVANSNGKMSGTHNTERTTSVIVLWLVRLPLPGPLLLPAANAAQLSAVGKRTETLIGTQKETRPPLHFLPRKPAKRKYDGSKRPKKVLSVKRLAMGLQLGVMRMRHRLGKRRWRKLSRRLRRVMKRMALRGWGLGHLLEGRRWRKKEMCWVAKG